MISRKTIDEIYNHARVEEVVGDFVQLKRSGSNLKGLSPFSNEKTPSFMVSPAKQIWKDFSSGKGGNVVSFLMELESYTYPEALRYLAKRYNISIIEDKTKTEEDIAAAKARESLFVLSEFAKNYFKKQLHNTEEGRSIGLSYLRERGFHPETMQKFELGYSPKQRDALAKEALEAGYSKEAIEQTGLAIFKEDGYTADRFRERIIFPILSFTGRTLGFGARILGDNRKTAKYLNSPESEIYHKSKILFGIFQSKQAISKQNNCYLVEGYTDVISLHQAGIENVVASSGTALTPEQARLIKRLTPNVTLVFDGDNAGIKAGLRGIDVLLEQGLNVMVLPLPEGEDPDSMTRKSDSEALLDYFKNQQREFIQFKAEVLWEQSNKTTADRAEVVKEVVRSIALIDNVVSRELYIKETATILGIREEVLFKSLAQTRNRLRDEHQKKAEREAKREQRLQIDSTENEEVDPIPLREEDLVQMMLRYGDLIIEIKDPGADEVRETTVIDEVIAHFEADEIEFQTQFYQTIYREILEGYRNEELRTGNFFLNFMETEIQQLAADSLMETNNVSENWEKKGVFMVPREIKVPKLLTDTIYRYKKCLLDERIKKILEELKNQNPESEEKREEHYKKIMLLTNQRNQIAGYLSQVIN